MGSRELRIEVASFADAEKVLEFFRSVGSQTEFLSIGASGLDLSPKEMGNYLARLSDSEDELFLLAYLDEDLAGVCSVTVDHRPRVTHIGDVFVAVDQSYWGHGLGSALFEEMLIWAQGYSPLRRLQLTVQARNEGAIAMYQKFAFVEEGRQERGARLSDGSFVDVLVMGRLID